MRGRHMRKAMGRIMDNNFMPVLKGENPLRPNSTPFSERRRYLPAA